MTTCHTGMSGLPSGGEETSVQPTEAEPAVDQGKHLRLIHPHPSKAGCLTVLEEVFGAVGALHTSVLVRVLQFWGTSSRVRVGRGCIADRRVRVQ